MEDSEATIKELRSIVDDLWKKGYPNKDSEMVANLYHEKFNLVDDEGSVFSKADEVAYVAEYGDQYQNFSYEIETACLYENGTAVISANCRFLGVDSGGAFSTEYVQSLTFSRIDGSWKIIYSQVSGVKEERIESAPTN